MKQEGTQKVIPTGSRSRTSATSGAPATMAFIVVAVGIYLLDALGIMDDLVQRFAQINVLIAEGEWWRIFTVVLLHGSITHILFNMWALWVLGPQGRFSYCQRRAVKLLGFLKFVFIDKDAPQIV